LFGARRGSSGLLCRCIFRLWTRLGYRDRIVPSRRPSVELVQRANRIISRPRVSPETDDATVQKLRDKSRKLENEGEEDIVQQLGPYIIPAMDEVPDPRLTWNADQPWFNYVPLPLNPNVLIDPLPLPKPKPDLVFCVVGQELAGLTEEPARHGCTSDMESESHSCEPS
jgi:hypothetical protein